jgi:hypothetical protein
MLNMSYEGELEPAVRLGYGDVINVAYEWQDNGLPMWVMSDHDLKAQMPALYVCANDEPQQSPLNVLYAGSVKLRRDSDGFWEPNLYAYGFGSTVPAVAVRVLGTLASNTMQELLGRNIHYLADRPELYERELSRINKASTQARRPNIYAVLADLSLIEDPRPYLAHQ